MKKPYTESVLFFGIIIPLVIIVLTLFICSRVLTSDKKALEAKVTTYEQNKLTINQVKRLEAETKDQNQQLNEWKALLGSEPSTQIMESLKASSKQYGKEMNQSSFSRSRLNTLAAETVHLNSGWDFTLRGSFRSLQKTFLRLEKNNPHLMLEKLEFRPDESSNTLTTSVTYSAWTLPTE